MPRETSLNRLKRQLAEAEDINRNLQEVMGSLRAQRDQASARAELSYSYQSRVEGLSLKNARLEGYIDRVREMDGIIPTASSFEPAEDRTTRFEPRRSITADDILAMTDTEFAKLLDNAQAKNRLDALMGRGNEDDYVD